MTHCSKTLITCIWNNIPEPLVCIISAQICLFAFCCVWRFTINQCSLASCQMAEMQQWPPMWRKSKNNTQNVFSLRPMLTSQWTLQVAVCRFRLSEWHVGAREPAVMQHDADWFEQMTVGKRDRRLLLNEPWRKHVAAISTQISALTAQTFVPHWKKS